MGKVEAKRGDVNVSIQMLSNAQLLFQVADGQPPNPVLFQLIVGYYSLDAQIKYLFQDVRELLDALGTLASNGPEESIQVQSSGKIHFVLEVVIFQKTIKKALTFQLQKQLSCEEQLQILRNNLADARKEIRDLKVQVQRLSEDNNQLKAKFAYLEQLITSNTVSKPQQKQPAKEEALRQNKTIPLEAKPEVKEQAIDEQSLKMVPLKVEIDPDCMYYSKFTIQDNRIASLHEDYYQIYTKCSLPKKGVFALRVKMAADNHMSMGLLGQSALKNQYSFQNNKAICLYSYFYGSFRGIYFRSKYEPLNWSIQQGEVIEMVIDMNEKVMKLGSKERKGVEIINFRSLFEQEPIHFFVQMYQKGNIIEFLQ